MTGELIAAALFVSLFAFFLMAVFIEQERARK